MAAMSCMCLPPPVLLTDDAKLVVTLLLVSTLSDVLPSFEKANQLSSIFCLYFILLDISQPGGSLRVAIDSAACVCRALSLPTGSYSGRMS